MNIKLPYGDRLVPIDVPDNWINGRNYRPHAVAACADADAELMAALQGLPENLSLANAAKGKHSCVIAVDGENLAALAGLLGTLIESIEDETEIAPAAITILISNRYLAPLGNADVEKCLSEDLLHHYKVRLHDPRRDRSLVEVGNSPSSKLPLAVNHHYMEGEFKVVLGGVRPDLLHGFTGGRSVLVPGLVGAETLRSFYNFSRIADQNARYGNYRHNPFHLIGIECLNMVGCDLGVAVSLNHAGEVAAINAGHFGQSHLAAMDFLRSKLVVPVREAMDIVVTSGGGRPHDDTLIQLISTLSAVMPVLKPEGTIVIAGALKDGLGPGAFAEVMRQHSTLEETMEFLSQHNGLVAGQWALQRLFSILATHEVILYNTEKSEDEVWQMGLTPTRDMNEAILGAMESHGQRCKIVALPDGPAGIGEIGVR